MKRKLFIKKIGLLALVPSVFIAACSNEQKLNGKAVKGNRKIFTCPMHPQVIKDVMGACPICGMDLVPFEKNNDDKTLKIDEKRQALANITTVLIGEGKLSGARQLNGRLVVNPAQSSYISGRIAGRIVELYIRETGVKVAKGQALYKLYSEQLATLQQEYLMAVAQEQQFQGDKVAQQIVASAKQKLLLYGQSESQLRQLVIAQKQDPYVVFFAPEGGVVAELAVNEGEYITEGSLILKLEGYGQLWVEADVYPNEVINVRLGQKVRVVVVGWEGQPHEMGVDFISPSLKSGTQLIQIRGSIANPRHQWQPGMQVNVFLPSESKTNVLTLPVDAVLRDGKGMHVWIKKGRDSFEPRLVKTGQENNSEAEISEGLKNGDQVVVTGAYLLYSEYILKKGKNPVEDLE